MDQVVLRNVTKRFTTKTLGDIVAVEATPGHDIGTVSMTGQLVLAQMKKYHIQ